MKPGVRLVNCARGELVDEAAVEAALRSGHIAAAALDVFREEPTRNTALLSAPNLLATPHLGASTNEGQEAVGIQIAKQVRDYLLQGIAQNAVNLPSLSDVEYKQIKPYMALAGKLGRFAAQLFVSNLAEIDVKFEGEIGGMEDAADSQRRRGRNSSSRKPKSPPISSTLRRRRRSAAWWSARLRDQAQCARQPDSSQTRPVPPARSSAAAPSFTAHRRA